MARLPSCGSYGRVLDLSTDPYVECSGCGKRFVGGDHDGRLDKWLAHANETGCRHAKARVHKVDATS